MSIQNLARGGIVQALQQGSKQPLGRDLNIPAKPATDRSEATLAAEYGRTALALQRADNKDIIWAAKLIVLRLCSLAAP